ncbi:hypothetical protein SAMN05443637_12232 [Pseudonocardia thermophila]|jgi:Predicted acetyltransferase|uniref:N-acetyltransferase domain-containing protein n=1 Tax=Pseudonocardia thermophila TaxID=1848 RepID=A0A1M6Z1U3_PSETH|nr:GNAT family N-acetyltransferase [Pseudonocardia thermophila]SHL24360.1 hypothetical protein SAMN05443637_12232 [Pseudonocardia thermophila]
MATTAGTVVADAPERSRYEISVDGERAGFVVYQLAPDHIAFVHTEIDAAHAGKGLAGVLVRHALDDARARGLRVVAVCPYVKSWIEKHPDYQDLTEQH